ncbi:MEKHLA domain-containing protein [Paenibacillus hamazuiensis]|uniref:MEKHLA domain-containing protein n=1 Tax=Paenibacillus hamazuiensis TaxID=2936508 RepID=UPI0020108585|nr:MEKHLA domain-containing protein [Paenibacillus hamazuiensis]
MQKKGLAESEAHARLLVDSYFRWTGKKLLDIDGAKPLAGQLFEAPIVILSHGTEADPVLNYGNRRALELWEMEWDAFTQTPSRQTAEPMMQAEREVFMRTVSEKGYVDNYTGIRISRTGKRFSINNATVWNLIDGEGRYVGQAAAIARHEYI